MIGRTLGHYRVESKLGAGGMGEVFRAHDLKLDRPVALKFIRSDLVGETEMRQRFEREARAIAALDHPYVGTVHGVEETDGHVFMVLAFVEGETLESIARRGPLPPERACVLLPRMAEGVAAAHAKGIVHRDIKSSNIMVADGDIPKVLDFGLALQRDEDRLTRSGVLSGTPSFIAPEIYRGESAGKAADVFSLGVVMHQALTGASPFRTENPVVTMNAILHEEPASFPASLPAAIRAYEPVVRCCLAKDPSARYSDAGALARRLHDPSGPLPAARTGGSAAASAVPPRAGSQGPVDPDAPTAPIPMPDVGGEASTRPRRRPR